jgi:hypothetical protein
MTYYEAWIFSLDDVRVNMVRHLFLGKFVSVEDALDSFKKIKITLEAGQIEEPYLAIAKFDEESQVDIEYPEKGLEVRLYGLDKV